MDRRARSRRRTAEDGGEPPDFTPLLLPAALANDSRIRDGALIGDPTEGALLALAAKGGLDHETLSRKMPRIAEIPFDSAYKFMATFHHDGDMARMYLKGAPDVLLARSGAWLAADGVNDAPALKNADIGVAMGITGTEVTKEAATMVLTDDNFATIVGAVREGRTIYDNIVKFVRFQLSTNMGAIQTMLGASLLGWSAPFTAIQILWINIIMDGPPAMTLGMEPARPGIMDAPPRPLDARILTARRLGNLMLHGLTMAAGTLAMFHYAQPQGPAYALTLAFTTFVLFQFFNAFNARAENGSAFNRHFFSNRSLWIALLSVLLLQALVVHWGPAQEIFHTADLEAIDWGWAFLVASSVLLLDEARKLASRLRGTARG